MILKNIEERTIQYVRRERAINISTQKDLIDSDGSKNIVTQEDLYTC